ncbi:MAG: hypothetical protein ABR554_01470 [Pyrinomonadaceae bacterium]
MKATSTAARIILASAAVALVLGAAPGAAPARAQREEGLPSFKQENILRLDRYTGQWGAGNVVTQRFRLSDGDDIIVSRKPNAVARDRVEFVLETGPRVTWWKGISVYKNDDRNGRVVTFKLDHVHTQDNDHGPKTFQLRMDQLPWGVVLSFEKAKALGAHTPMYGLQLFETDDDLAGQRITFRWEKDR